MINKNIVNYEKLKTILEALWNKTKDKFIEDIVYEVDTNELSKTKNGTKEVVIDHVVERWGDLEHTLHPKNKNIFDKDTQVTDNKYYFVGVGFVNDQNWCMAAIPCSGGEQFTIVKMSNHDSKHFAFLDEIGSLVGELSTPIQTTVNGKAVYKITIPSDLTDVAYFTVNMHKQTVTQDQVMVFSGHLEDNEIPNVYYPYLGDLDVEIDGDKVGIRFDKDSTFLQSDTVVEAIKELDNKVAKLGSVTSNNVIGDRTVLMDGVVKGPQLLSASHNNTDIQVMEQGEFFCCANLRFDSKTSPTQVTIGMSDEYKVGDVVTGVNIGVARHVGGSNYRFDNLKITDGTAIVHENTNANISSRNAITVDVVGDFNSDDILVVGVKGAKLGSHNETAELFRPTNTNTTFTMTRGRGKIGEVVVHHSETPLAHIVKDVSFNGAVLTFYRADGTKKYIDIRVGNETAWS